MQSPELRWVVPTLRQQGPEASSHAGPDDSGRQKTSAWAPHTVTAPLAQAAVFPT